MAKFTSPPIASSADITPAVNNRIQRIVDELNGRVLYRSVPIGEPNAMSNDIDMGRNDIINAGLVACRSLLVAGGTEVGGDGGAILDLVATINQLEDDVVLLQAADGLLEGRVVSLEGDVPPLGGRLDIIEPTVSTHTSEISGLDSRVEALENYELCLITVNTGTIPLTTTPQTISGNTDIFVNGITRDAEGAIVYPQACRYIISWTLKLLTSSNVTVYLWIESYLPSTDEWVPVPYSGIQRDLPSIREVEISSSYLRLVPEIGMRFRIRMAASSNGSVSLAPTTLPNGTMMPSVRLDIRN